MSLSEIIKYSEFLDDNGDIVIFISRHSNDPNGYSWEVIDSCERGNCNDFDFWKDNYDAAAIAAKKAYYSKGATK